MLQVTRALAAVPLQCIPSLMALLLLLEAGLCWRFWSSDWMSRWVRGWVGGCTRGKEKP